MIVIEQSVQYALTLPTPGEDTTTPARSTGLHVSDLVYRAAVDLGHLKPDDADYPMVRTFNPDQVAVNRMCLGLAWEDWLAVRYRNHITFHPGELTLHGVAGSPDGAVFHPQTGNVLCIDEFKCTWKSTKHTVNSFWYWLAQIQAYCYMCSCLNARLHVYHVNGSYKPPAPIYRVYALQFSPYELAENWALLNKYRTSQERM